MSLIGTEVLPFTAQAYHKGDFVEVTEENFKGKWSVVCFYPADFTFVCPTELGDLQDQYATLKDLGVEVYSVSTDTHFTHKAWHDHSDTINKIEYVMIGDPSQKSHATSTCWTKKKDLLTAVHSSSIQTARSKQLKSMPAVSDVTQAHS